LSESEEESADIVAFVNDDHVKRNTTIEKDTSMNDADVSQTVLLTEDGLLAAADKTGDGELR